MNNAVKFTPPDGRIDVRASSGPVGLIIEVSDTGPGIPPEDLERVLHPYEQSAAAPQNAHGTGLGLPIAASMSVLLGGRLELRSELRLGTTVSIYLPPEVFNIDPQ